MIGQKQLLEKIQTEIDNNKFPRFALILGQHGSGKKTLATEIGKMLNAYVCMQEDVKIDTIRNVILNANKVTSKTVYILPDADKMSLAAKNAMLKLAEEPPNNAYIVMTLEDENNTLETIRSRARTYRMENYTSDLIFEYAKSKYENISQSDIISIQELCETPLEVDMMIKSNVSEFISYVEKVISNINKVSDANAFKISSKLALKDDAEGYDLRLFLKAFLTLCARSLTDDIIQYGAGIRITSKYLQEMRITGINKQSLFDMWILDIRKAWRN